MTTDATPDAAREGRLIRSERLLQATPAQLAQAYADAGLLARWWGPKGFRNTFAHFDLRAGGEWVFTMHGPDGTDYPNRSVFHAVEPGRIVMEHVVAPHFTMTMAYAEEQAGQTRLRWVAEFDSPAIRDRLAPVVVPSNEENFDRLQAVLSAMPAI